MKHAIVIIWFAYNSGYNGRAGSKHHWVGGYKKNAKTESKGGSQTRVIDQDERGGMYFANNESLKTISGWYWKIFSLPNRTIVWSVGVAAGAKWQTGR